MNFIRSLIHMLWMVITVIPWALAVVVASLAVPLARVDLRPALLSVVVVVVPPVTLAVLPAGLALGLAMGLTLAFAVENFASKERVRRREIYSGGLRSSGVVATRELRSAQLDPWLSLRLRKTF